MKALSAYFNIYRVMNVAFLSYNCILMIHDKDDRATYIYLTV